MNLPVVAFARDDVFDRSRVVRGSTDAIAATYYAVCIGATS